MNTKICIYDSNPEYVSDSCLFLFGEEAFELRPGDQIALMDDQGIMHKKFAQVLSVHIMWIEDALVEHAKNNHEVVEEHDTVSSVYGDDYDIDSEEESLEEIGDQDWLERRLKERYTDIEVDGVDTFVCVVYVT